MHSGLIGGFPRDIALKDKLNQAFRALLTVWNQYRPHIYAGGIVFVIPRNAVFFHRIVHIGERICRKEKYLVLCHIGLDQAQAIVQRFVDRPNIGIFKLVHQAGQYIQVSAQRITHSFGQCAVKTKSLTIWTSLKQRT